MWVYTILNLKDTLTHEFRTLIYKGTDDKGEKKSITIEATLMYPEIGQELI